jgi:hypothetical protein
VWTSAADLDVAERRAVVVTFADRENLLKKVDPVGRNIRILGEQFGIVGITGARPGSRSTD